MEYLNSKGFVHRDLALRNILVDNTHKNVRIADLGLTRVRLFLVLLLDTVYSLQLMKVTNVKTFVGRQLCLQVSQHHVEHYSV